MGRPSRALLTRERIAAAALQVVDEEGADGLTMRALADRLGVKAASLYNHIESKESLVDAVSGLVNDEIDHGPLADADWRAGLAAYARGYRAVFLRHPNAIALLARRRVEADSALRGYDALLALLGRAGLGPADAAEVAAALDYLVLGSAMETFTAGFAREPAAYRPEYPALADALDGSFARGGGATGLDDRGFELGLGLLLDGVARRTE
ncbi:TetR/AcrR family transcriptional regulator C-terminal domain-containing protein [Streptomyces sp. SP17BM10]|uniref:TetR/AcrR family transcriptional regulator n=1 Tax=Streptomyces sp. SP17BM10 TaxID=3002530 RepID=UPI002E7A6A21|nr:TetR/AcrR family transcriptional regulator C-terminal domain-containing protein [Streptomyces sp. SP17BM10]MEE1786555.1 TetR/AcrR family transcriptional regulator C-terminal domain-containing protein [Streptomyces sp. SP17BM10]